MDTEPGGNRRERVVDWLESHPDLPHLFARLAELVHVAGYAPEDLVVLPRAEVDRRETAAFTAGWAEAVSDELPRIRREYERRLADAYAQGQGDARGIRRPQRRTDAHAQDGAGARVIPLPFARLLEPPAAVVQAEERVRRERELFEQRPEPEREPAFVPGQGTGPDRGTGSDLVPVPAPVPEPDADTEPGTEPGTEPDTDPGPEADQGRTRRNAQPVRKVVRGKGGRPIVPPLDNVPAQDARAGARGRRLSERARALEEELAAERAQEAPPEPAP